MDWTFDRDNDTSDFVQFDLSFLLPFLPTENATIAGQVESNAEDKIVPPEEREQEAKHPDHPMGNRIGHEAEDAIGRSHRKGQIHRRNPTYVGIINHDLILACLHFIETNV
jgi:hypothetical protein